VHLDLGPAAPSAASTALVSVNSWLERGYYDLRSVSCGDVVTLDLVEDVDALYMVSEYHQTDLTINTYEKSASEPQASRDEGESFSRLPLVADAPTVKTIPMERRAAVNPMDPAAS
jgi:hypothetical protein